jgi:hypothetical protein
MATVPMAAAVATLEPLTAAKIAQATMFDCRSPPAGR